MRIERELVAEAPAELLQLAPGAGADSADPLSPGVRTLGQARRRLRQRALVDGLVLAAGVTASTFLFADLADRLLAGIAGAGAALVIFLARRDQDLARAAEAARAARSAMAGRGIPLADWHAGRPLPDWESRRRGAN